MSGQLVPASIRDRVDGAGEFRSLLAVQGEAVPAHVRALAEEHAAPLVEWSAGFGETVARIRRYLDAAGSGAEGG